MAEPIFTVQDVLTRLRLLKADSSYSADSLLIWLTDGLIELYTHCQKSRTDPASGGLREYALLTDTTQAIPTSIIFLPLLVDYVAARAFMQDADSQDHRSRAAEHFKLFFDRAQLIQYGMPNRQTPAPPAAPGGTR